MILFKRNTTKDYSKPKRGKSFYGGGKKTKETNTRKGRNQTQNNQRYLYTNKKIL